MPAEPAPAPPDEIRAAGPADDPAAVELALEIGELLAQRKRREAALAALYDTAGDLSSLRDTDRVLEAIARRARQLLRSDASYLMLHDEARGDTYMRVTDGVETPEFKAVRLAMGVGLGGLVAQDATGYWTAVVTVRPGCASSTPTTSP